MFWKGAVNGPKQAGLYRLQENSAELRQESGHDFSRAANAAKSFRALASEGMLIREINLIRGFLRIRLLLRSRVSIACRAALNGLETTIA
jgi:hypothetical protein